MALTDAAALLLGLTVGTLILRHPLMRSARATTLVAICALGAAILGRIEVIWGPIAAVAIGFLPLLVATRFPIVISALAPPDFDEHRLIERLRHSLAGDALTDDAVERDAIALLTGSPPPAPEWQPVREALLKQIGLRSSHRTWRRNVSLEEALSSRRELDRAWWAAIRARSRFFR